jgi:predicted aspartyl protease
VRGEQKGKSLFGICIVLGLGGFLLILQGGCAQPAGYATSTGNDELISKSVDWPYSIEVIKRADGRKDYYWQIDSRIEQDTTALLKYHEMYRRYHFAVVEGSIGVGGKKYPIVIDTGASQPLIVKQIHVKENNLRVYPLKTSGKANAETDVCYLPELLLGPVKLINWACLELKSHWAGLGVRDDFAVVGLPVLREFKYVRFDDISEQVELSKDKVFEPNDSQLWAKYPLWIEEDFSGNAFLLTKIPIDGQEMELQIDTGSGRGLAISEELWEQLPADARCVSLKQTRELYPYIGNLKCRTATVPELSLGDKALHNVPVSVFADDSPLVDDYGGLLGMQLFRKAVVVLDFENGLLWLKQS